MNGEAEWMFMAMLKGSALRATPGSGSVAVCEETTDEDGARNLQTTSSSTANEMGTGPAPQGKKGGGAPEWTPGETKLLIYYYYKYFPQVGAFKKLKNKKMLFKQVSQDLADVLGCSKTPQQCKNRVKTVRRQKRKACDNNMSGAQPCPVPFDDEMRKIESIDDSLEPEVLRDSYGATYKATSSSSDSSADVSSTSPEISSTPASGSDSGKSTKVPADTEKRELRARTSRMQQMQYFFDQMRAISAERAARREELEKEKEMRRAERRAERIQERQERRKMHEDKLQLIREALGFKQ
ncbi:uncharacterized protein LOC142784642 [Rhipicephalus microplus]|uniref:uncharacterized protein LOC142784642 n=1 Tax=Rhipicephalus microplus TaxID=6941 RepID=UPI003F6C1A4B